MSANSKRFVFSYDSTSGKYGTSIDGTFFPFGESGTDVSDTTATTADVLSNKYFYTSDGVRTQGSITQRSASSTTISGSQTYYSGYYPSNWTVTGLDTSDATAAAKNIERGYTAYAKGSKITGTATGITHGLGKYNGSYQKLSQIRNNHVAVSVGDYSLHLGGSRTNSTIGDVYDKNLTRSSIDFVNLTEATSSSIGNYGLVLVYNTMYTFDSSLTKSTITAPSFTTANMYRVPSINLYNYALFIQPSLYTSYGNTHPINAYDTNLVRSNVTNTSGYGNNDGPLCSSNSAYAIIGSTDASFCNTYSVNLVRGSTTAISDDKADCFRTLNDNYAIFAGGGKAGYIAAYTSVNAYNTSATKSTPSSLPQAIKMYPYHVTQPKFFNYGIVTGGLYYDSSSTAMYSANTVAYNNSLTKSTITGLSEARSQFASSIVGEYYIISGGFSSVGSGTQGYVYHDTVDIYTIT